MPTREPRPDALIIGAPKAGTSALHAALARHPQVYASPVKEPKYYLCTDAPPPAYVGPGDAHSRQEWVWRADDYAALFEPAPTGSVRLESTPFYLYERSARRRIAEELPEARLVVVVRDPVDRAYSNLMHLYVDGLEPEADFVAACRSEDARVRAGWAPFWHYRRMGRYGEQLADLFAHVERERVLVLRYFQLVSAPVETLDTVARFLGIREGLVDTVPPDNSRRFVRRGLRTEVLSRAVRLGAAAGAYAPPQAWRWVNRPLTRALQLGGPDRRPRLSAAHRRGTLPPCDVWRLKTQEQPLSVTSGARRSRSLWMRGPEGAARCQGRGMGSFRKDVGRTVRPRRRSELLGDEVPRRTLAGRSWRQVALGWHVPADAPRTPAQRIVEAVEVVPRGCLSGWAAAYVFGADVFDGRDSLSGRAEDVRVVLPPSASRVVAAGIRCVRVELDEQEITERHGMRLTTPLRTAVDLAREASDLVEAVVALDGLLRARVLHPQQLARLATVRSLRGSAQARRAVTLARVGVRSPWETRLRLFAELEARLPELSVNVPVFDLDGNFLGAPDLLDVEAGLGLEFDGAGHRERERHRTDNVREEGFERHGLVVVRADSLDLTQHRSQLGHRIVAGRRDALRNVAPRRWTVEAPSAWRGLPA